MYKSNGNFIIEKYINWARKYAGLEIGNSRKKWLRNLKHIIRIYLIWKMEREREKKTA